MDFLCISRDQGLLASRSQALRPQETKPFLKAREGERRFLWSPLWIIGAFWKYFVTAFDWSKNVVRSCTAIQQKQHIAKIRWEKICSAYKSGYNPKYTHDYASAFKHILADVYFWVLVNTLYVVGFCHSEITHKRNLRVLERALHCLHALCT